SRSSESIVDCLIDLSISPFQFEASDPDASRRRLCRFCRGVLRGKAILKKFHALDCVINVSTHWTYGVEMLFNRVNALGWNQTESGLQADDTTTGGRHTNGAGRIRADSHVRHSRRQRDGISRGGSARDQISL